jgi:hypothetical protein
MTVASEVTVICIFIIVRANKRKVNVIFGGEKGCERQYNFSLIWVKYNKKELVWQMLLC